MIKKGFSHAIRLASFIFSVEVGYYPYFEWWYLFPSGVLIVIAVFMGDEAWRVNLNALACLRRYSAILKSILIQYSIALLVVVIGFGIGIGLREFLT